MKSNKINANQILNTCIIIIGFSLTIISFFISQKIEIPKTIFLFIVFPFSIEAIMVTVYNYFGKLKKIIDSFLILCFVSLFFALTKLFFPTILPNLDDMFKNNFIIGVLVSLFFLFYIVFVSFMVWLETISLKTKLELKNKIFDSFYRLSKKIEKNNNYPAHIAVIFDDFFLNILVEEVIKEKISGYSIRFYNTKDFFKNNITDLIQEKIIIITDLQDNLLEIVDKFKKDNNVLGILSTFNISSTQKKKLVFYNIITEECDVGRKNLKK